jgi:ATP-binding cassette subfamily C (CFTR/MRP) protein 1
VPFVGRKVPREPYPSLEEAPLIPLATASAFSKWTFWWIQPLLITGYQRTLQPRDLWKLSPDLNSGYLADKLLENFHRRKDSVEAHNKALADGTYVPGMGTRAWWKVRSGVFGVGRADGKRTIGLAGAISDTFFYRFWSAGAIKVVGDTSQILSPLVTKALINFSTESYLAARGVPGYTAPHIGVGVGLSFALWFMSILYSLCTNQFFARSASTGVLTRGALIAAIYRRSMVLSGKSRTTITNGKIVNHISTDVSRIDFCCGFFHMSWSTSSFLLLPPRLVLTVWRFQPHRFNSSSSSSSSVSTSDPRLPSPESPSSSSLCESPSLSSSILH